MSTPLPVPGQGTPSGHGYEVPDFEPEPGEILQEEEVEELHVIPVTVVDPVRSQLMPAKLGGFRSFEVGTTQAVQILGRDPRRKRAVITIHDNTDAGTAHGVYLGTTQSGANTTYGFLLPFNIRGTGLGAGGGPLELTTMDEIWALTEDTGNGKVIVSVLSEQWAY